MSEQPAKLDGPDLAQGIELASLADGGMLLGHADGEAVLLVRRGEEVFAIGATCTHYGGPLAEGLVVGETIRCPWHHACFSLRSGQVLRAPALDAISCWRVEVVPDTVGAMTRALSTSRMIYVREKLTRASRQSRPMTADVPASIVIVGGGAAGNAAAETLRHEGYRGRITLLSADAARPCDRPSLSKSYLAGTLSEEATLLRSAQFYQQRDIELRLGARVVAIDTGRQQVALADGSHQPYGALLLATGAAPVPLEVPGAERAQLHYLRTLADSRALVAQAITAKRAVVIGASFIGLEVAASLRARNIEVHVVGREAIPMARILGPEVGNFIRALHQQHGVTFHLGTTVASMDARSVTLQGGEVVPADLVVVGIGVRPAIALGDSAGLAVDRGVLVDQYLQTSVARVYAAGDIARWPDRRSGERIRIEHFVVAERQGQTAARNMLGRQEVFDAVPFFWTEQYDFGISYVGHAERWDQTQIDGSLAGSDCTISYWQAGKRRAVAVVHRDLAGLRAEVEFEQVVS